MEGGVYKCVVASCSPVVLSICTYMPSVASQVGVQPLILASASSYTHPMSRSNSTKSKRDSGIFSRISLKRLSQSSVPCEATTMPVQYRLVSTTQFLLYALVTLSAILTLCFGVTFEVKVL